MELLVFARALDQSGGYIRENQAILASGRISVRDEKEPQLMADEIRPLDTPEAGGAAGGGGAEALHPPARPGRSQDPKGEAGPLLFPGGAAGGAVLPGYPEAVQGILYDTPLPAGRPERAAGGEENVVVQ